MLSFLPCSSALGELEVSGDTLLAYILMIYFCLFWVEVCEFIVVENIVYGKETSLVNVYLSIVISECG